MSDEHCNQAPSKTRGTGEERGERDRRGEERAEGRGQRADGRGHTCSRAERSRVEQSREIDDEKPAYLGGVPVDQHVGGDEEIVLGVGELCP